jgi:hypothetical protein
VTGGSDGTSALASAEVYDPAHDSWSDAGLMAAARVHHTAAISPWGAVLIVGGEKTGTLEAYGTNGQFRTLGTLATARTDYALAMMPNHKMLVIGGTDGSSNVATVEMYDADANTITSVGSIATARRNFAAAPLYDGTVLVTGGIANDGTILDTTEIFDPASGKSAAGPALSAPRANHQALLLPNNGSVMVLGGNSNDGPLSVTEVYTPWTGRMSGTPRQITSHASMNASLLKRGGLVVAGGQQSGRYLSGSEQYRFATIESRKGDYAPGEIASFTGSGWKPGEEVQLSIQAFPIDQHQVEFTASAVADGSGQISISGFNIDRSHFGGRFLAYATGSQSKAQTIFTDANATLTSITSVTPGTQVFGGSVAIQGTVSDSAVAGANPINGGTVNITVDGVATGLNPIVAPSGSIGSFSTSTSAIAPGVHDIQAVFSGCNGCGNGGQNEAASTSASTPLTVTNTVTVVVTSPSGTSSLGTSLAFTATLTPGSGAPSLANNGTVTFTINNTCGNLASPITLGPVNAAASVTSNYAQLPACTGLNQYSVVATYIPAANNGYSQTPSAPQNFKVSPVTPTVSITANPPSPVFGNTVTFNIAVLPTAGAPALIPTGTVGLTDTVAGTGGANTSGIQLDGNGKATYSTNTLVSASSGSQTHAVQASYSPAGSEKNYNTNAAGNTVSFAVTQATGSTSVAVNPSTSVNVGANITLTGTYSSPATAANGYVISGDQATFYLDGAPITSPNCQNLSLTAGQVSCPNVPTAALTIGNHTITMGVTGDANIASVAFNGANALVTNLNVTAATSTTSVSATSATNGLGTTVVYTGTVTVSPSSAAPTTPGAMGTLAFFDNGNAVACDTGIQTLSVPASGVSTATCGIKYDGSVGRTAGAHNVTAVFSALTGITGSNNSSSPYVETISPVTITFGGAPGFTPNASPIALGTADSVRIAVNANAPNVAAAPTLPFNVLDNGAIIGTAAVVFGGNSAHALPASLINAAGNHSITFAYPTGDVNYAVVNSSESTLVVTKANTTTTASGFVPGPTYGRSTTVGGTVTQASGAATPTGTLTFSFGATQLGTCNLASGNCTLTFTNAALTVAADTITIAYSGDNNYNSSTGTGSITPVQNTTNNSFQASPASPSAFGTNVTFTLAMTASGAGAVGVPTGTIAFTDSVGGSMGGAVTLVNGIASISSSTLTPGPHTITATYLGDTNFSGSAPTVSYTINVATTITTLTVSTANVTLGTGPGSTATFSYSVTGGPSSTQPVGTVTINDNGVPITNGAGTCAVSGNNFTGGSGNTSSGSCTIVYDASAADKGAGTHNLTAVYAPSGASIGVVSGSTSAAKTVTASANTASITIPSPANGNPLVWGQASGAVTVQVTGLQPQSASNVLSGNVDFYDGANLLAPTGSIALTGCVNNVCTATLPTQNFTVGVHTLTAKYLGNTIYAPVTSAPLQLTVNKANTATALAAGPNTTYGIAATLTATVTTPLPGSGTPTGTVNFMNGATQIGTGTLNGAGQATMVLTTQLAAGGPYTLSAVYGGDSNANGSTGTASDTVAKNSLTVAVTSNPPSPVAAFSPVTFTATLTPAGGGVGSPAGTVTFTDSIGSVNLGSGTISNGVATLTTSSIVPNANARTITATLTTDTSSNFTVPAAGTYLNGTLNFTVQPATTTVTLTPTPTSVAIGGTVIYNYSVTGGPTSGPVPTGSVTIQDNGNPISNGSGTCVPTGNGFSGGTGNTATGSCTVIYDNGTADRGLGTHNMTAHYVPSGASIGVLADTVAALKTVSVGQLSVGISQPVSSAGASITYGTQTKFSVTLTPGSPTPAYQGPVVFYDNGVQIASIVSATGTPQTANILLSAGAHQITAQFVGGTGSDPNYASSPTSAVLNVNVGKAKAPLSISGSLPAYTVTYGGFPPDLGTTNRQSLTTGLVTVAAVGSGVTPTGTVTVSSNGIVIATNTLNNVGTTTFTTVTMSGSINAGSGQNLTFTYSGDANYLQPDPASGTNFFPNGLNVNPALSSAVVSSSPINSVAYGQNVTFTATLTGPGNPANGAITFTSDGVAINATCTAATPNPVTNNIATCTAAATTANHLGAGAHAISVSQFTDTLGNHTLPIANITPIAAFVVTPPSPTITITSDVNPSVYGQTVNITATACGPAGAPAPVGQIQLFDGGASLGSLRQKTGSAANCSTYALVVPSSGVSLFTGGVHAISATYVALQNDNTTADPNYVGGSSQSQVPPGVLQQTVNQAPSVTSAITVTANPSTIVFGESVTLTVTVKPTGSNGGTPTGLVSFTMNGSPLANAVTLQNVGGNQTASLTLNTLAVGNDPITATYQGDANFATSTSTNAPTTVTVNKDGTLTIVNTGGWPNPANYGGQITLTATVCGLTAGAPVDTATFNNCSNSLPQKPTGSVTFFDGGTALCGGSGLQSCPVIDGNGNASLTLLMQNPPFANTGGGAVAGNHTISARYNGDGNFGATTSGQQSNNAQTLTINKGTTSSAVTTNVNPSVYGQPVQFTATVAAPNSGAILPTGSVDFVDGGVVIAQNVPLANVGGVMTASVSAGPSGGAGTLSVGQHTISVVYHGDANYLTSSTPISGPQALVETVNKAVTTTSISSSANAANTGQQIVLTAVVSVSSPGAGVPTGTVQFIYQNAPTQPQVLGSAPVVVTAVQGQGNLNIATLTLSNGLPAGNPQIVASYSGDTNFVSSQSAPLTQAVNKTATNITFSSSLNPSIYGNQVTFSVTVSPLPPGTGTPTGQIVIYDGTVNLGTFTLQGGVYNFLTSSLLPGAHAIAVQYNGDTNFQPFTSPAIQQNVSKVPTSLNMTSNAFTAIASQVITLTAVLNPNPVPGVPFASGQVGFYDGAALIGVANLQSNVATLNVANLSVGLHQLSAIYTGDNFWTGSTSGYFAETITLAATQTQIVSSANPSVYGQPVTYTVTVTVPFPGTVPASGQVQISDNHNNIGDPISANNGTFNITFNNFTPGVHNIVATFVGNASFASSQSATLPQVVNKAATTTTLAALPNGTTSNQSVTLTAVVNVTSPGVGSPTGTVEFTNTTFNQSLGTAALKLVGGVYVATLTTKQLNQSGSPQVLTATYSGDDNFATSTSNPQGQSVFGTQVTAVNGASQTVANYAPDMWVTLYGENMASTTLTASQNPYPTSLAGTTVTITDANGTVRQAPLYFVSPTQVNMLIPTNTAFGLATLTVTNPNGASASTIILVTRTAPGLFTASQSGTGVAAALVQRVKSDGSQSIEQVVQFDSSGQPVPLPITVGGDSIYLQFYGTGIRYNPGLQKVTCTIGGQNAQVLYAGAAPGFAGLDQVNVALPANFSQKGTVNVVVTVDGQAANTVTLAFQ